MRYRYDDDGNEVPQTLEQFGEQIKDELREEYIHNENQKNFWREFYDAYPILRANRHVVLAVWQENIDTFMASTPETAMEVLATKSKERINWLDRTAVQRRDAAVMVGGPGMEGASANDQRVEMPESMGSKIKARKEHRREADRGFRSRQRPSNEPTYGRAAR